MGIPSYFRRIIQKYPGIVSDTPKVKADALCFDFNCLIYRCIRQVTEEDFETNLLREVCKTVKEVWHAAGKPKRVFLAVDGVVPMAKIRQQRVRRFKSAWLRKEGWDSNAITPGTEFMDRLTKELEGILLAGWELSSVQEPGEGEHKIMKWLVANPVNAIIYGLDADLILLSMLASSPLDSPVLKLSLMREKQEFEKSVASQGQSQEYSFMDIEELKNRVGVKGRNEIVNYVALMSLMGNDFLPHSITHKLGDDGYEYVIRAFNTMKKTDQWIVIDGKLQIPILIEICKEWSEDEEVRMLNMIQKKRQQAMRGILKGMDESEGLPLEWDVEKVMMKGGRLSENWRDVYWSWISADRKTLCAEYIYGCQWILDYYSQKPVNMAWMFPAWIPPLWSDLAAVCEFVPVSVLRHGEQPSPSEQLAMVLPLKSWDLVRGELRILPSLAPQMWPLKFDFFSVGRRWLWECEARVPVLTAARVRDILNQGRIDGKCTSCS